MAAYGAGDAERYARRLTETRAMAKLPVKAEAMPMILEWAAAGAVILAGLIFCVRIMRRGITTLDEDRAQ